MILIKIVSIVIVHTVAEIINTYRILTQDFVKVITIKTAAIDSRICWLFTAKFARMNKKEQNGTQRER